MPRQDDNSDRPNTLPPPELDPTLNPVLGQNMGRWAEVYFTNAPEKRDEAVLELLRTLEAESAPHENGPQEGEHEEAASTPPPLAVAHAPAQQTSSKSQIVEDPPALIECDSCGRENRAHQRFCGMCGARLQKEAKGAVQIEEPQIEEPPRAFSAPSPQSWERLRPLEPPVEEKALPSGEFSPVQEGDDRDSSDHFLNRFSDESPGRNSSLYYVGAALAIVILAVSYIAWRGAHATSGTTRSAPEISRQPTQPTVPAPTPTVPVSGTSALNQSAVAAEPPSKPTGTDLGSNLGAGEAILPAAKASDAKNQETVAIAGSGSEELATARRYLNGTDGQQRDTAAAVDWLWKAVAKRNTEAALLLSELFLKGDGVAQNCDQGRVLLDAAASRGSKDAAERLRHLQAFGCQ